MKLADIVDDVKIMIVLLPVGFIAAVMFLTEFEPLFKWNDDLFRIYKYFEIGVVILLYFIEFIGLIILSIHKDRTNKEI